MEPGRPRTNLQRLGHERARRVRQDLGVEIATLRQDSGLSRRAMAAAAGLSPTTVSDIEAARRTPGLEALARIGIVLGANLSVRLYPGTGPPIRDHVQAAMVQALIRALQPGWIRTLEVPVFRPVRGVIDLVLERLPAPEIVAVEAHSELRRIEQQVRWATMKAEALAVSRAESPQTVTVSRLLLLRSTSSTRRVALEYADLLATAYPARQRDLLAALRGTDPWPGSGILWCRVDRAGPVLLTSPPRGVRVGR